MTNQDQDSRRSLNDWRQVVERYVRALAVHRENVQSLSRRWTRLSYCRGGLFLGSLLAAVLAWQAEGGGRLLWWTVAGLLAVAFLVVVAIHDWTERALETSRQLVGMFAESVARCRRDWRSVPIPAIQPPDRFRPISNDLDVFGMASLSQLFSSVRTANGLSTLRDWMSTAAIPTEIEARQVAVSDLVQKTTWREEFQLKCRIAGQSPVGSEDFLAWVQSPGWIDRRPALIWFARLSACLTAVFGVGFVTAWIPAHIAGVGVIAMLALNFLTTVFSSGKVHEIFEQVSSRKNEVEQFVALFGQLAALDSTSPRLVELRNAVTEGPQAASRGLRSLSCIVWLGNLRRHGVLFLAYLFLQFATLWDLHVLIVLEGWQRRYRAKVPAWFASLGQAEVLTAMSTAAYEHPEWVLPRVEPLPRPSIQADQMGHPLLPNDRRVCNDVELGPPGNVVIITGSNMSGKSTMLRSIGLNTILAQMGSPVCARRMVLHPVVLDTSIRITDSLSAGVSFFMAELHRLKEIVDHSLEIRAGGGQFLFLLDEILQGTNSRERHVAVGAVIQKLLDNGALGSFTTHDLDLAQDNGLAGRSRAVYFTESFHPTAEGEKMTFDYVMRPGIAPTTNALHLLKFVGLAAANAPTEWRGAESRRRADP